MTNAAQENLNWIRAGKTGCNFATLFSKNPEAIGWHFVDWSINRTGFKYRFPKDALIISIMFDNWCKDTVRKWIKSHDGFYEEKTADGCVGLRYVSDHGVSWVQYFGPDADVITRRAPHPMLMMCVKLPLLYSLRVGFKGILHLAHASVAGLSTRRIASLWTTSYLRTAKLLGHKPTIKEAAKTTFHI